MRDCTFSQPYKQYFFILTKTTTSDYQWALQSAISFMIIIMEILITIDQWKCLHITVTVGGMAAITIL